MPEAGAHTPPSSEPETRPVSAASAPPILGRERYPERIVGVVGRLRHGEVPSDAGVRLTADLSQPCGLIAVLSGKPQTVFAKLAAQGQLLTPIADFTEDANLPRADTRPRYFSTSTLHEALAATRRLRERLSALPAWAGHADHAALTALTLAATRDTRIDAGWDPATPAMVGYGLLAGLTRQRTLLEQLAETGLLTRRFFDRVHLCGDCGAARMAAREVCPACRSSQLDEMSLVHHYRCGHQGPRPAFEQRETHQLVCPKCRRIVRHYGVDYDVPGSVTVCMACGETTSDPDAAFTCADCGATTPADAAAMRDWFHYELSPSGWEAVHTGNVPTTDLQALLRGQQVPGHQAPRDLAVLINYSRRVFNRYERPFLAMTVQPRPRADAGGAKRARAFTLATDVIRDTLRESDFVSALPEQIVILLPETPRDQATRVRERLSAQLREVMGDHGDAAIREVDDAGLDALVERLRHA